MQATLVSHYCEKPEELAVLIRYCQKLVSGGLAGITMGSYGIEHARSLTTHLRFGNVS